MPDYFSLIIDVIADTHADTHYAIAQSRTRATTAMPTFIAAVGRLGAMFVCLKANWEHLWAGTRSKSPGTAKQMNSR